MYLKLPVSIMGNVQGVTLQPPISILGNVQGVTLQLPLCAKRVALSVAVCVDSFSRRFTRRVNRQILGF